MYPENRQIKANTYEEIENPTLQVQHAKKNTFSTISKLNGGGGIRVPKDLQRAKASKELGDLLHPWYH